MLAIYLVVNLFLLCLSISSVMAEETPFLEFKRRIAVNNLKSNTDFAMNQHLFAITGDASLFLANEQMVTLFPHNVLAPLKAVCIDYRNDVWALDANTHEIIKLNTGSGDIKRLPATHVFMHAPTDISRYANGVFVWEQGSGHYAYLDYKGNVISSGQHKQAYQCIAKDGANRVCINARQNGIQMYHHHQLIAHYKSTEAYSRYSDIAISQAGQIWVSDPAAGKVLGFSARLQSLLISDLVSANIQHPQRISLVDNSIWLLDSAQQAVIELTLRTASSGFEHQLLAEEYHALGNAQAAWKQITLAEALAQPTDALWLLKGKVLYTLQQYDQAILNFKKIGLNKFSSDINDKNYWLGNAYYRLKQYKRAATAYRTMDTLIARYNLGVVYFEQKKYHLAQPIFASLLKQKPDDHWSRLAIIETYIANEQFYLALQHSRILLPHPQLGRHARFYIGLIRFKMGQIDSAIDYLQRASKEGPYYTLALQTLADAYTQRGELSLADKSMKTLQKVREYKQELKTISIKDTL